MRRRETCSLPQVRPAVVNGGRVYAHVGFVAVAPADDGGYVTLALPPHTDPSVFDGFKWSASSTGMGQVCVALCSLLGAD